MRTLFVVLLVAGAGATSLAGQAIPFSQRGAVSQRVGVTDIDLVYNRPVARGRTLFGPGGLIKFDQIWHPGADSATRVAFSRAVHVEGRPVPPGEYSLWLTPRATGPWTLIVSRAARVFHQPYPGEGDDALRVDVLPETGAHMETLAYYFPVVARDSTVLRLHWGTTIVPIRIRATLAK